MTGSVTDGIRLDEPGRVLQQVLVTTDGTVVRLLEAWFGERIVLWDHEQSARPATPTDPAPLELAQGERVLDRSVVLRGSRSGRRYVSAETLIALDRLDASVREELMSTSRPIGRVLRAHRVETFREILEVDRSGTDGPEPREDRWELSRTYRIFAGGRPVMLITEHFLAPTSAARGGEDSPAPAGREPSPTSPGIPGS